jgi:BolA-like protein 3
MRKLLSEKLSATHCTVEDTSGGCGAFFRVVCVSPMFEGMRPLAQHRAVQAVLSAEIGAMHGLTIETMTPALWASKTTPA